MQMEISASEANFRSQLFSISQPPTSPILLTLSFPYGQKYYAVKVGRIPGVYTSFGEAREQTNGFSKGHLKGFKTHEEAAAYISRPRAQQNNSRVQAAKAKAAEAEARAKAEAEAKAHAEWEAGQARARAQTDARWRERAAQQDLSQAQRLAAEVERELEDAKALVDAKKRAVISARITVNGKTEAWAEAIAHIDGREKKQLLYASGDRLYDSLERAKGAADGKVIYKCYSMEQASYAFKKNGHATFQNLTGNDLSYVNNKGETVYQVFTDGSSRQNGGAGAAGGIGVYFGQNNRLNVSGRLEGSHQSSQRAELAVALKAYRTIDSEGKGRKYEILTDSGYLIDCLTKWIFTWRRNDWRKGNGQAVKKQDLLSDLIDLQDKHPKIELKKVKGHMATLLEIKRLTGLRGLGLIHLLSKRPTAVVPPVSDHRIFYRRITEAAPRCSLTTGSRRFVRCI